MPEEAEYGGERTETATPKKRQEARKKGKVAKSQEINSVVILLAGTIMLYFYAPRIIATINELIRYYYLNSYSFSFDPGDAYTHAVTFMFQLFSMLLPILLLLLVVGFMVNVMQIGFLVNEDALVPKFDRLNPLPKLKNIFSKRGLAELIKSLLKIGVVGFVCYRIIYSYFPIIIPLTGADPATILTIIGMLAFKITIWAIFAMLVLAIFDYAFQRWQYEESIKMTKQELKQELKDVEGDPLIRARVRSIQREMARQRMMREVPTAEVVITNPTEIAIALSYNPDTMDTPVVVAKGRGFIAEKIRDIANENGVPLVENPPLAQALFKSVEIGASIPGGFFKAVAEVLAYVYKMKKPKWRQNFAQEARV